MEIQVNTVQARDIVSRISLSVEARADLAVFKEIAVKVSGAKMYFASMAPGTETAEFLTLSERQKSKLTTSIPAKTLQSILSTLTEETFLFKVTEKQVHIISGKSHFRLSRRPADEVLFPKMDLDGLVWDPFSLETLCRGTRKVSVCASKEGKRPQHTVIHVDKEYLVATDSRVMALAESPFPNIVWEFDFGADRLNRVARALQKTGSQEATFAHTEEKMFIRCGNLWISLTSMALAYPNYRGIVLGRTKGRTTMVVPRAPLLAAINQMSILSSNEDNLRVIQFTFEEGGVSLTAKTGIGDGESFLEWPSTKTQEKILQFDVDLLLKGISTFEQNEIEVFMEETNRPAMFSEPGYDFFINPLRVS